jgi:hypothetical protein
MLLNAAFLDRLGQVFMKKNPSKDLPYGPGWGRYFWICRCQNRVQGPRDRVYTVEKCLDRFCALGRVRFRRLLGFHQDFRSQKLLQAPKMDISGDKCKVLFIKELSYDLVVLIEVREYLSVCVWMLGLTLVAVVVEIWGKISPLGEFGVRSQRGNGMVL